MNLHPYKGYSGVPLPISSFEQRASDYRCEFCFLFSIAYSLTILGPGDETIKSRQADHSGYEPGSTT